MNGTLRATAPEGAESLDELGLGSRNLPGLLNGFPVMFQLESASIDTNETETKGIWAKGEEQNTQSVRESIAQ